MASSVGKAGQGAVEQFLLLAKSARGKALADLVARATADPGLYGFGELLDLPQIQSLRSTEHAPFVALLELFAYGTWLDYRAASSALPTLSEAQVVKLKQLTVASAAQGAQVVPYADLMAQLEIGTVRELENFLISSCMYGGVLQGSLDQQNGRQTVRRRLRLQGLAAGQAARPDTDSPAMGGHLHGGLQRARDHRGGDGHGGVGRCCGGQGVPQGAGGPEVPFQRREGYRSVGAGQG